MINICTYIYIYTYIYGIIVSYCLFYLYACVFNRRCQGNGLFIRKSILHDADNTQPRKHDTNGQIRPTAQHSGLKRCVEPHCSIRSLRLVSFPVIGLKGKNDTWQPDNLRGSGLQKLSYELAPLETQARLYLQQFGCSGMSEGWDLVSEPGFLRFFTISGRRLTYSVLCTETRTAVILPDSWYHINTTFLWVCLIYLGEFKNFSKLSSSFFRKSRSLFSLWIPSLLLFFGKLWVDNIERIWNGCCFR